MVKSIGFFARYSKKENGCHYAITVMTIKISCKKKIYSNHYHHLLQCGLSVVITRAHLYKPFHGPIALLGPYGRIFRDDRLPIMTLTMLTMVMVMMMRLWIMMKWRQGIGCLGVKRTPVELGASYLNHTARGPSLVSHLIRSGFYITKKCTITCLDTFQMLKVVTSGLWLSSSINHNFCVKMFIPWILHYMFESKERINYNRTCLIIFYRWFAKIPMSMSFELS